MEQKYVIQDWASNYLQHNGKFNLSAYGANKGVPMEFDSTDDAWEYLYQKYPDEECFEDFFVVELE